MKLFERLWKDDAGFIFSFELMLVFVILLLGIVGGLTSLRSAVNSELAETGNAILALDQGYAIGATSGCCGHSDGTAANDTNGRVTWNCTTTAPNLAETQAVDVVSCAP